MQISGLTFSAALVLHLLASQAALRAQTVPPGDFLPSAPIRNSVAIELSVKGTVIHEGEPILLRISVVNREPVTISTTILAPWDAVTLTINRGDGRTVEPPKPNVLGYHSLADTLIATKC
jgi:hypothetical protein